MGVSLKGCTRTSLFVTFFKDKAKICKSRHNKKTYIVCKSSSSASFTKQLPLISPSSPSITTGYKYCHTCQCFDAEFSASAGRQAETAGEDGSGILAADWPRPAHLGTAGLHIFCQQHQPSQPTDRSDRQTDTGRI